MAPLLSLFLLLVIVDDMNSLSNCGNKLWKVPSELSSSLDLLSSIFDLLEVVDPVIFSSVLSASLILRLPRIFPSSIEELSSLVEWISPSLCIFEKEDSW